MKRLFVYLLLVLGAAAFCVRFVWTVSQSDRPLVVTPELPAGHRLRPLLADGPAATPTHPTVTLAPYGVEVHLLEHVEGHLS